MVVLEMVALLAPPPRRIDVPASIPVPLTDRPPDGRGDVARGGQGVGLREALAGAACRGEAVGFEPLERLRDGRFDDRTEVTVGNLWPHESTQPFELLVEPGAGGELHLVPPRGEGLQNEGGGARGCTTGRGTGCATSSPLDTEPGEGQATCGPLEAGIAANGSFGSCSRLDVTVLPFPDGVGAAVLGVGIVVAEAGAVVTDGVTGGARAASSAPGASA
jgi:hypothetical protein